LQHPGVVPVYDIGQFGNRPFFTMKLVKGQTLAALLADRNDAGANRPRLLGIALQVTQTLAYAHAKGVIHRDLKPANVMVGAFGEVQVMDWGLAKVLADEGVADENRASRAHQDPGNLSTIRTARNSGKAGSADAVTEAGSLLGTPAYMPPEQANGEINRLDRRADVFGLGAILCEILTGRPPYVGRSSEEVLLQAANGNLAGAMERLDRCEADQELIELTKRCLAPQASDRPADARAVADGLSAHLNSVQERLQAAERERAVAMVREAEQRKRRRVQLALAGTVALLLLGGGTVAWRQNEQAVARRETDLRRQLEDEKRGAADNARLARNAEATTALLDQCEKALRDWPGDAAKAAVALDAARQRSAEGGAEKEAARVGRLAADLDLLHDLNAIDQFRWTWVDDKFPDPAVVATQTREALTRFGADPDAVSADEAIASLSASVIRERIVSALDRLLRDQKTAGVRAALARLDADPYRNAVRDAVLANDHPKMIELAGRAAALEQPPSFAAFLGESQAVDVVRRRQLLEAAVSRQSEDLRLLMTLGNTYFKKNEGVNERLRWFQAAIAAAPANTAAHINLGNALRENGRWDEAIACFQKAIDLDPKFAIGYINLGIALAHKGQWNEAIALYRKAVEHYPKFARGHFLLGNALEYKGHLDEAIAEFRKAIDLAPNDADVHVSLGASLAKSGKMSEAITEFHKAIDFDPGSAIRDYRMVLALRDNVKYFQLLDHAIAKFRKNLGPNDATLHGSLGMALERKGQWDEAIAEYHQAIALDPNDFCSCINLGSILRIHKGQLDEAIATFKKAIAMAPQSTVARFNLAWTLQQKKQWDEAIAEFQQLRVLAPRDKSVHSDLGQLFAVKKQWDEAIACFKKAAELDPKDRNTAWLLKYGVNNKALADCSKAIERDPMNAKAWCDRGVAHINLEQWNEAVADCSKAIALDRGLVLAWRSLGEARGSMKEWKRAIGDFSEAIKLEPSFAETWLDRSIAHVMLGQPEKALTDYYEAVRLDPKNAAAHNTMAYWLANHSDPKVRRPKKAVEIAKQAIALSPKEADYWHTLGIAHYRAGNWRAAITALNTSIWLQSDRPSDAYWLFISMAYWQLGEKEEARKCYDKAGKWLKGHEPERLARYREEASKLLGIESDKGP
jgi:eukaryotic-like serine/threonine-protein kinase